MHWSHWLHWFSTSAHYWLLFYTEFFLVLTSKLNRPVHSTWPWTKRSVSRRLQQSPFLFFFCVCHLFQQNCLTMSIPGLQQTQAHDEAVSLSFFPFPPSKHVQLIFFSFSPRCLLLPITSGVECSAAVFHLLQCEMTFLDKLLINSLVILHPFMTICLFPLLFASLPVFCADFFLCFVSSCASACSSKLFAWHPSS